MQKLPKLTRTVALAAFAGALPLGFAMRAAGDEQSPANANPAPAAQNLAPIMTVDEVRVGMKGYGLTVFHGTKIEPFPLEVVSVIPTSTPARATIWIRCFDPRLDVSGPVQGMSGSPIYLWEEGEEGTPGEGGRLIGAFAFGHSMVEECLAGVQPIEYMRDVATRTDTVTPRPPGAAAGFPTHALRTLATLQTLATQQRVPAAHRFRLDAITQLMRRSSPQVALPDEASAAAVPPSPRDEGRAMPLMLPMSVRSPQVAALMAPLFEPMGIMPVAGAAAGTFGKPPHGIDVEAVQLENGSVLSVPLVFGDLDLAAVGTVTEILPDGKVIGFGHPFLGQGDVALPMATGYVHFVVPRITTSFKESGSLKLVGSLVEDEAAAVAGVSEKRYKTAPLEVTVAMPGQPEETFHYELANHPQFTPALAAIAAMESLGAAQMPPTESTMRLTAQMTFTGGRTLEANTVIAPAEPMGLVVEILPAIGAVMNNPHENLQLESMKVTARIEPTLEVASIVHGRLDKAEVAPGDRVGITVTVQPYGREERVYRTSLQVPANLPEGDYQLMVFDASTYAMMSMANRPHRMSTATVDDLIDTLQDVMDVKVDALYAVLQLPEQGVAIGRTELPRLPSSRKAIIATPTSTLASPFTETAERRIDTDTVVSGQLSFTLAVRRERVPSAATPGGQPGQPNQPRRP